MSNRGANRQWWIGGDEDEEDEDVESEEEYRSDDGTSSEGRGTARQFNTIGAGMNNDRQRQAETGKRSGLKALGRLLKE